MLYTKMSVEYGWNGTDRGRSKYSEINMSRRRVVHHKSHMD